MQSNPFWRKATRRSERAPLRCQFVVTSMPVGGAETLLVNLMRRMDRTRFSPELLCLKQPGPLGEAIASEFPLHSQLLRGKYDFSVIRRLARRMRGVDVVVTVGAGDKMFWGRLAANLARVPVIASALHSTGWPDGVGRLNRLLTPLTDAFIAVADAHGRHLVSGERFPEDKVHVIRNGVDCDRFHPDPSARESVRAELGLGSDVNLLGIVAALRPEKNHGMLIRCAARLRQTHPNLHWLIVGDGDERPGLEKLADILKVNDRLHFLGTRHDTPRLLASLDGFSLCSLNEASPVSILEALACQVPVIAADVGSIGETVVAEETGWLFQRDDLEGMTQAVKQLLANPLLGERMGEAGRAEVLRRGSLDSMVHGYQQLFDQAYDRAVAERSLSGTRVPTTPGA